MTRAALLLALCAGAALLLEPAAGASASATRSRAPAAGATRSRTASVTRTCSGTASRSRSRKSKGDATRTRTPLAATPAGTAMPTASPRASLTASLTASRSPTGTASGTGSPSASLTASGTGSTTSTGTASLTPSGTRTPTASATAPPSATGTVSGTGTPTASATASRSTTGTVSGTGTPTASATASRSTTGTVSGTGTLSGTATPTLSGTRTLSGTPTPSGTPTLSGTQTPSGTGTPTPTASASPTLPAAARLASALASGNSSLVSGDELRASLRSLGGVAAAFQSLVLAQVWRNLTNVTWNPTHDSAVLRVDDPGLAVPLVLSNFDYKYANGEAELIAVAGSVDMATTLAGAPGGRFLAWGGNPLHDAAHASNVPGGVTNAPFRQLLFNAMGWLLGTGNASVALPSAARINITVAQLSDSYWFNHDADSREWLVAAWPRAGVNAINACDNALLDTPACLGRSQLLVIGRQMDSEDGTSGPAANRATNVTAIAAAVRAFLRRGGAVCYVHYDGGNNALSAALLAELGGGYAYDNYWQAAGLQNASTLVLEAAVGAGGGMAPYLRLLDALTGAAPLTPADVAPCVAGEVSSWRSCDAPGFVAKVRTGASALRDALAGHDEAGEELFALPRRVATKLLVLLGDKYRANSGVRDAGTPPLSYPLPFASDLTRWVGALFGDAAVLYRRAAAPAQDELGTLYCPRSALHAGTCAALGYDYRTWLARVPRHAALPVSDAVPPSDAWSSTGVFALPGQPFTVARTDALPVRTALRLWFQRESVTKAFGVDGAGRSRLDRPQSPRSPAIAVPAGGAPVTVTSPYGGPVYVEYSGAQAAAAGGRVQLVFGGVARHPAILDVGNASQVAAFVADFVTNPLPAVDLKARGFEVHARRDKLTATLSGAQTELLVDYAGPSGLRTLLDDHVTHFVFSAYTLLGLKLPGRLLADTLPPAVQAVCRSLAWNCTDATLHAPTNVQHANYDEDAACGGGCSGNPFDMSWNVFPLGWGESHELGHNLQMRATDIHYVASELGPAGRDSWANYQNRAGENSNNVMPYHTSWRYYRLHRNHSGAVDVGHMDPREPFAVLQSAYARVNRTVGGVPRLVTLWPDCSTRRDFPLGTPPRDMIHETIYSSGEYAADNGDRMVFYLQLPLLLAGATMADGATVLTNGFDIFALLAAAARMLGRCGGSDVAWAACRVGLGMGGLPRTGAPVYAGGDVRGMPGNDFMLIVLSRVTGRDWRAHWDVRGVPYSSAAAAAVAALAAAGALPHGNATSDVFYAVAGNDLPPADLTRGVPTVRLDGSAPWPIQDGWAPVTTCVLGLRSPTATATASRSGSPTRPAASSAPPLPSGTASATGSLRPGASPSPTGSPASAVASVVRLTAAPGTCLHLLEVLVVSTAGQLVSLASGGAVARWAAGAAASWVLGPWAAIDGCMRVAVPGAVGGGGCAWAQSDCAAGGSPPSWEVALPPTAGAMGAVYVVPRADASTYAAALVTGRANVTLHRANGAEVARFALSSAATTHVAVAPVALAPAPLAPGTEWERTALVRTVRVQAPVDFLHFKELFVLDERGFNVALGRPVSGSAQYGGDASAYRNEYGNDGIVDRDAGALNILHSAGGGGFWQVDLLGGFNVTRLVLWNRSGPTASRLAGATITFANAYGQRIGPVVTLSSDHVQVADVELRG